MPAHAEAHHSRQGRRPKAYTLADIRDDRLNSDEDRGFYTGAEVERRAAGNTEGNAGCVRLLGYRVGLRMPFSAPTKTRIARHAVDCGRVGLHAIACWPRRLWDPDAVISEKIEKIETSPPLLCCRLCCLAHQVCLAFNEHNDLDL
jgi:hypothetical protein